MSGAPRKLTGADKNVISVFLNTARDENNDLGEPEKMFTYDQVVGDLLLYLENIDEL